MISAFRRLSAAASALALSACLLTGGDSLVTPGGAEDFPNTVNQFGRIAVGDLSSGSQFEQLQSVQTPELPQIGGLDSLTVSQPLSRRPAGLGRAAVEGVVRDTVVDLTPGRQIEFIFFSRLYVYLLDSSATGMRRDTVVCKYIGTEPFYEISGKMDSIRAFPLKFLRPLEARGVIRAGTGSDWQTFRIVDLDGRGAMDWAEYMVYNRAADSSLLRKRVRVYGPDSAYAAANAVPEEYELLRRGPRNDTLEWTLVQDVSGNIQRRLWNDSGTGRVEIRFKVVNPSSQPEVARLQSRTRADLRHNAVTGDSLKQLFYEEQRWLRNGRVSTFSIQGWKTPGGLLRSGDSARLVIDTVFALRDSTIRYTALYNLLVGSPPERMQGHSLVGYGLTKFWRRGPVFSTVSTFAPTVPVPMGQSGFEGRMAFTAAYMNGDTLRTEGDVTRDSLNLTMSQVKAGVASTYQIVLDAAGNLVRPPIKDTAASLTRRPPLRPLRP